MIVQRARKVITARSTHRIQSHAHQAHSLPLLVAAQVRTVLTPHGLRAMLLAPSARLDHSAHITVLTRHTLVARATTRSPVLRSARTARLAGRVAALPLLQLPTKRPSAPAKTARSSLIPPSRDTIESPVQEVTTALMTHFLRSLALEAPGVMLEDSLSLSQIAQTQLLVSMPIVRA